MNTDPLLQSVNRYAEHNKILSIAISVRGEQVAPAKGEPMHLGDAAEYWKRQADGDAKVWGAIVGFTFNIISLELNEQYWRPLHIAFSFTKGSWMTCLIMWTG